VSLVKPPFPIPALTSGSSGCSRFASAIDHRSTAGDPVQIIRENLFQYYAKFRLLHIQTVCFPVPTVNESRVFVGVRALVFKIQ
jgi:hypothetical protein